jgi:hypothetical protein
VILSVIHNSQDSLDSASTFKGVYFIIHAIAVSSCSVQLLGCMSRLSNVCMHICNVDSGLVNIFDFHIRLPVHEVQRKHVETSVHSGLYFPKFVLLQ